MFKREKNRKIDMHKTALMWWMLNQSSTLNR